MTDLLHIKNVTKSFGPKIIYQDITFSFDIGCHAITGQNGAGKTVLIEMLAGVSLQNSGEINMNGIGQNYSLEYKKKLTYVPGKPSFFPDATGIDFLNFVSSIKFCNWNDNINSLVNDFKLASHLNTKFKDMSLGTQKKLFLSTIVLGNSQLIILDEPSNALDEPSRLVLQETINEISFKKIVIIASHDNDFLDSINKKTIHINSTPVSELLSNP